MRQRLVIIITIGAVLAVLIVLNAITYVAGKGAPDTEWVPNRSSYNSGATGTRAFYELLSESGYDVMRWREPLARLLLDQDLRVKTFVIVGRAIVTPTEEDAQSLYRWVEAGGRLVIIDRKPPVELLPKAGDWKVKTGRADFLTDVDPANAEQMTAGVKPLLPVQPTLLTRGVEAVLPSRFASWTTFNREVTEKIAVGGTLEPENLQARPDTSNAPVVHLGDSDGALLIDFAYGRGRVVLLSDPYMVANGGINLNDNAQLAVNIAAAEGGLIAFDEFHQGKTSTHNPFVSYFAGTPVLAICGQIVVIILALLWTRGRRLARPLPVPAVDRRSTLEFVASMAELQQRARALDLAVENIYSRIRRVLTRYAGVDYHSSRAEIAERVAGRSSVNRQKLEMLMKNCEVTINGAPVSERQAIQMVRNLREVEQALGLRMRSRDLKQM